MSKRPTRYPRFGYAADYGQIVEPTIGVQQQGFSVGRRPPAPWFNYMFNLLGGWVDYLKGPSTEDWNRIDIDHTTVDSRDGEVLLAPIGITLPPAWMACDNATPDNGFLTRFVAFGLSNTDDYVRVYYSHDGVDWGRQHPSHVPNFIGTPRGIIAASRWILWTSDKIFSTPLNDGVTASAVGDGSTTDWVDGSVSEVNGVAYDQNTGTYLLARGNTTASWYKSSNGSSWTAATVTGSVATATYAAICWDGSAFVSITGAGEVWGTPAIGTALTKKGDTTAAVWLLAGGDDTVLAVGKYYATGTQAQYSKDHGVTWTAITLPSLMQHIRQVIYFDGQWIAVGDDYPYMWVSSDLVNWVGAPVPRKLAETGFALWSVCAGRGCITAMSQNFDTVIQSLHAKDATLGDPMTFNAPVPLSDAAYFRGKPLTTDAPLDQQFYIYDNSSGQWVLTSVGALVVASWVPGDVAVRGRTTGPLPAHTSTGTVLTASSNGAFPVTDGLTYAAGDRILVANEGGGTSVDNDIYEFSSVGDSTHPWAMVRVSSIVLKTGIMVSVGAGTSYGANQFILTTDVATIVRGTTAITWGTPPTGAVLTGDVNGAATANTVSKILGRTVRSVTPGNRNVLAWDSTNSYWDSVAFVADGIKSATTSVDTSASAAPSANRVLRATDSTHAVWANNDYIGASGVVSTYHGGASLASDSIEVVTASGVLSATKLAHDCDTTAGSLTVQLPSAASVGDVHFISNDNGSFAVHKLTVTVEGGGTINDSSIPLDIVDGYAGRSFKKKSTSAWVNYR